MSGPTHHPSHQSGQPPTSDLDAAHQHHQIGAANANHSVHNTNHNNAPQVKPSMSMDSQYMQQQSQIFVFSTKLANEAADAIINRQFTSIIQFHCSQPGTKAFLEKHPLKVQQFNCQSPAPWLNNLAQMRPGGRGMKGNMNQFNTGTMHPPMPGQALMSPRGHLPPCSVSCNHGPRGCGAACPPPGSVVNSGACTNWTPSVHNMCSDVPWQSQQSFAQNPDLNANPRFPNALGNGPRASGPNSAMSCGPPYAGPNSFQSNNSSIFNVQSGLGAHQHLIGSEIPDENLTPQQRQHREKQLARIRKMQQQLLPELMPESSSPLNSMNQGSNILRLPSSQSSDCNQIMDPSMRMGSCVLPADEQPMNNMMIPSSTAGVSSASQMQQNPTTLSSGQNPLECPRMPHQFGDDRTSGPPKSNMSGPSSVPTSHPSPLSQPSSNINSPSPSIVASPGSARMPLPPPYHQGPRPGLSSPHPGSPAPNLSLPLSSPRMQSPADASRQPFPTSEASRLPPHASPRPATPAESGSMTPSGVEVPAPSPKRETTSSSIVNNCAVPRTTLASANSSVSSNVSNPSISTPSPSSSKKLSLGPQTPLSLNQESVKCNDNTTAQVTGTSTSLTSVTSFDRKVQPDMVSILPSPNCSSPFRGPKVEHALMPVPSPHEYLNAFEGQELTIQKQPNTSLRDADLISPPGLDLNFANDFGNTPCTGPPGVDNMSRFNVMESMNPRFPSNPAMNNNPMFEMNQRFMSPSDSNCQRFGSSFDNSLPPRMQNCNMPNLPEGCPPFRGQNMNYMGFSSDVRFQNPEMMMMQGPRLRGPNTVEMGPRFPSHINDSMQSPSNAMSPMGNEPIMPFSSPVPDCISGPGNNFCSPGMESGVSSTHLQNLQKMTPPFDIGPSSKLDSLMVSNGPSGHNMMHAQISQGQRMPHFDSVAPLGEPGPPNQLNPAQGMMPSGMNMSSMQVASNGPQSANMASFQASISSMHQNMPNNSIGNVPNGASGQFGMSQISHNPSGVPQTVNNTYVNAAMSIQQLNIQNVPSPSFTSSMQQTMGNSVNMPMTQSHNVSVASTVNSPPGNMQMMGSNGPKGAAAGMMPSGFGPRNGTPFGQGNNPRGMSPVGFPGSPNMMSRGPSPYNPNIQVKPNAPNTIQYLPARPQNANQNPMNRPSLDFLQRFAPPLTNLDNKLPTHNLQYFPNNGGNMNNIQSQPGVSTGMPMQTSSCPPNANIGPINIGIRPSIGGPMRGSNPNIMGGPPHQSMMGISGDVFGRPPGPNGMGNGSHGVVGPNAMFSGKPVSPMSPVNPMAPNTTQPLPPSVGHSYNYKQSQFYGPMMDDPNYAVGYRNFQQQLYATNTRGNTSNGGNQTMNSGMPPGPNFFGPTK